MENIKDILRDKKVFIFDFDGTMSDTAFFHLEVLNDFLKAHNVEIAKECFYGMVGLSHKDLTEYLNVNYNLNLKYEDLLQCYLSNSMSLLDKKPLRCYPYVLDLLQEYANVDFIVLSNQLEPTIKKCLDKWGISNRIRQIITTTGGKLKKRDVYSDTFRYFGVEQKQCVVFEDSRKYLNYAKQANILTVGISHWINNGDIQADYIIEVPEHYW